MAEISLLERSNDGILQPIERPVLAWMAQRLPDWVTPNGLTAIGFIGACIAAAGYALSSWQPVFLWLATAGLWVNWYGDSLDGTVARVRQIERPRYGFFLDQTLDALAQLVVVIGIGFSGFVRFEFAILTLAVYFLMSIVALARAIVSNVFSLTYAGIGLTELRLVFSILNVIMFFLPPKPLAVFGHTMLYPEVLTLTWAFSMLISFIFAVRADLQKLAIEDTPPSKN